MSPFCKLGESAGPVKWVEDVQGLYKDVPGYIKELRSPMRDLYKTADMRKQDLLKTEVIDKVKYFILFTKLRTEPNTMPLRETLRLLTYFLENLQPLVNMF